MNERLDVHDRLLIELSEHINKVAEISEVNDRNLADTFEVVNGRLHDIVLAPTIAIAAIVIALDKKGILDRKDVIATMDGLVSSLTPPGTNKDAALLVDLIIKFLRHESAGTLGDEW